MVERERGRDRVGALKNCSKATACASRVVACKSLQPPRAARAVRGQTIGVTRSGLATEVPLRAIGEVSRLEVEPGKFYVCLAFAQAWRGYSIVSVWDIAVEDLARTGVKLRCTVCARSKGGSTTSMHNVA